MKPSSIFIARLWPRNDPSEGKPSLKDPLTQKRLTLLLFCIATVCFSFKTQEGGLQKGFLQENETLVFSNGLAANEKMVSYKGSKNHLDGSGYSLAIDSNYLSIIKIKKAKWPTSDQFTLLNCTGSLKLKEGALTLTLEKTLKHYFLVSIDHQSIVGEFDSVKSVVLKSETVDGSLGEFYCSEKHSGLINKTGQANNKNTNTPNDISAIHLFAYPSDISLEDLMLEEARPKRSLAHFSEVVVISENNKTQRFPGGSYILFEINALEMY